MVAPEYRLIRSSRKTIALYITPRGLEVRAPRAMPISAIDRFVQSKRAWIEKHRANLCSETDATAEFGLGYGDAIPFRGKACPIVGSPKMRTTRPGYMKGEYADGAFLITEGLQPSEIGFILSRVLKREAEGYIPARVRHYAERMRLSPDSVRITSALGRWGSCSAQRRLNFAWMLMMADDAAIDSVVVHELAHMIHPDHSAAFHRKVREYCPDYDRQHAKLEALGLKIRREGWRR
ncbi:MAG: M48 family metallopeptidase [Clostridiales Family XIII bacterium]|jgi:predicted metal-dependent hydrolase|nr:M48 family metallopeptidase [Clostridiales Family XIII bacterium]